MSLPERLKLMILDDHAVVRDCLARALAGEHDISVVASCGTISDALAALKDNVVDTVLLDFDLGFQRGTDFIGQARSIGFGGHIVVLTAWLEKSDAAVLLASGVQAILLKDQPLEIVIHTIRSLRDGAPPAEGPRWDFPEESEAPLDNAPGFSEREQKVLSMIVAGLANKEFAGHIAMSETAVKATLQRLFAKVGVRTRGQLVRVAIERYSALL